MKKNTHKPGRETKNVAIYIQAKSFKTETFGGAKIQVADFTYTYAIRAKNHPVMWLPVLRNANGMQMDLLHTKVEAAKLR